MVKIYAINVTKWNANKDLKYNGLFFCLYLIRRLLVRIFDNYSANFLFGLRPYNAVRTAGTSCCAISSNRDSNVLQIFILFFCASNSIPPHVCGDK